MKQIDLNPVKIQPVSGPTRSNYGLNSRSILGLKAPSVGERVNRLTYD